MKLVSQRKTQTTTLPPLSTTTPKTTKNHVERVYSELISATTPYMMSATTELLYRKVFRFGKIGMHLGIGSREIDEGSGSYPGGTSKEDAIEGEDDDKENGECLRGSQRRVEMHRCVAMKDSGSP
ncbi:hypothetical protein ACSQ67_023790 [Phaseolus vulgaris]